MRTTIFLLLIGMACLAAPEHRATADALERLKPERLAAVRKDLEAFKKQRCDIRRAGPYREFRANLHVHSSLSHDSRGTIDEIVAAAKTVGTQVLMFTEHPAETYDFFNDGHQGIKDGVLVIPGAETKGFLAFPTRSMRGLETGTPQEFSDLVRRHAGLVFLSHLEERMTWEIRGLTGTEIYNTHADFKDEKALRWFFVNPLSLWNSLDTFREYPQEAFSALQDYPNDYLKRWDQLCQRTPHTGIAANDAHQNVGLVVRLAEDGKARFEDALGKRIFELDADALPALKTLRQNKNVGDILVQHRLDPYENSLRHVGTHLLMTELSTKAVWDALEAGRVFVAFDWIADATGFDFHATLDGNRHEMGSRIVLKPGLRFHGQAPLPGKWKLVQDGKVVTEATGRSLDVAVTDAGVYRVEVWLKLAGEDIVWILSNPIYVV